MTMKDKILDAAERRVRAGGFAAMSFRDLAADVGIKSASVHYYFPTKAELGEALVARYAEAFASQLHQIDQASLAAALRGFVDLYDKALVLNEKICLCAVLGAEAIGLPAGINQRTGGFFQMNCDWLEALLHRHGQARPAARACMFIAALEGGMILASASGKRVLFDQVAQAALESLIAGRVSEVVEI